MMKEMDIVNVQLQQKKRQQKPEPRFAFMTKSEVDHLEDGFRWRKYGQKAVNKSPFPRSYYRCTATSCIVKKRVERLEDDPTIVVTSYEGQHNHPNPLLPITFSTGLYPPDEPTAFSLGSPSPSGFLNNSDMLGATTTHSTFFSLPNSPLAYRPPIHHETAPVVWTSGDVYRQGKRFCSGSTTSSGDSGGREGGGKYIDNVNSISCYNANAVVPLVRDKGLLQDVVANSHAMMRIEQ